MSETVEISVVMPCRNVARWLPRCLDEVLSALPAAAEVIAVEDGSTDETPEILRSYSAEEARLRILTTASRGVSAARNAALDAARGEYVFFVDPDDGVEPDFFTALSDALRRDDAEACLCGYRTRAENGVLGETVLPKTDYRLRSNDEIRTVYLPRIIGYSLEDVRNWYAGRPLFADREMAQVWRMAYRRDLIERFRIRFDENIAYGEDAIFNAECLLHAVSMTSVARPLYRFTDRSDGATRTVLGDGGRLCRNKLALLAARKRLDEIAGGRLTPLYAASCVFSALEILRATVCGSLPRREGMRLLKRYLSDETARSALHDFPLSVRHPQVAFAVGCLRCLRRPPSEPR